MRPDSPMTDDNLSEMILDHCPDLLALLDVNGMFLYSNASRSGQWSRIISDRLSSVIGESCLISCAARRTVIASAKMTARLSAEVNYERVTLYAPICFFSASQIRVLHCVRTAASRPSSSKRAFGSVPE